MTSSHLHPVQLLWLAALVCGCGSEPPEDPTRGAGSADRTFEALRDAHDQVHIEASIETYVRSCSDAAELLEQTEQGLRRPPEELPSSHNHRGYYLDGAYIRPSCNLGCDVVRCGSLSRTRPLSAVRHVLSGTDAAPGGAPVDPGFPCAPRDPESGDAGVGRDAGALASDREVDVFESVPLGPELVVRFEYYETDDCSGPAQTATVAVREDRTGEPDPVVQPTLVGERAR